MTVLTLVDILKPEKYFVSYTLRHKNAISTDMAFVFFNAIVLS